MDSGGPVYLQDLKPDATTTVVPTWVLVSLGHGDCYARMEGDRLKIYKSAYPLARAAKEI